MFFLLLVLDGVAPPIGLTSVTARVNGTSMVMEGRYESGASTPILFWPKGNVPWSNSCKNTKDLCCLRDLNAKYRNDALASVQGAQCLKSLPPNLVSGSRPSVTSGAGSFQATVPADTPFVAILFVHASPFFILDGYQGFTTHPGGLAESSLVIANNPCYSVVVPGTLASVCMQCHNPLPANAHYVWTSSWYVSYLCDWQCNADFARDGGECVGAARSIPLVGIIVGACAAVVVMIVVIYCSLQRNLPPPEPEVEVYKVHSDMIQFKDNATLPPLRIKRS
jgi:hypothetical protein